jgi:hypothetical protein
VLGGNLGGLTSMLLGLDGGHLAGRLHVDVLVPVRGFKRCFDTVNGFGAASFAQQPACAAALCLSCTL